MTRTEYNKLKEEKAERIFRAEMSDWYALTLKERAEIEEWWRTEVLPRVEAEGITEE